MRQRIPQDITLTCDGSHKGKTKHKEKKRKTQRQNTNDKKKLKGKKAKHTQGKPKTQGRKEKRQYTKKGEIESTWKKIQNTRRKGKNQRNGKTQIRCPTQWYEKPNL